MDALLNAQPNLAEGQSFERDFPKGLERTEGYVPTNNPVSMSVSVPQMPNVIPDTTGADPDRWTIYDSDGNETWKCYTGKVWRVYPDSTQSETSITDADAELSFSSGDTLYLECDDVALTGLTLKVGNSFDIYEQTDGNMTAYRYILGDFTSSDPGIASQELTVGNTTVYYRTRVGDYDLKPNAVYMLIDAEPIWAVEFGPY